jgi:hypothetical protein
MIGAMMLTFLLFFAFVLNTGMLVNAKINLQNAADVAAYAGASVQARQMNQISFLNYELRRQYKKFLFRYYVMGNMAQDTHPNESGEANRNPRTWKPNASAPDLEVPMTCLVFGTGAGGGDNYCRVDNVAAIAMPSAAVQDTLNNVVQQQLQSIEIIKQNSCKAIGDLNSQVSLFWLFNTDPSLANLRAASISPDDKKRLDATVALSAGMGLYPRNLITELRIRTLEFYINRQPERGLSLERAKQLMSGAQDAASRERPFNAFFSAYNSLGENTFSDEDAIVMDELLPQKSLDLKTLNVSFDIYTAKAGLGGCGPGQIDNPTTPASFTPQACHLCPISFALKSTPVPVAVMKNSAAPVSYGVKLTAKAKTLFNPFGGDLTLTAYSAAKPFGSRIGPQVTESDFTRQAKNTAFCAQPGNDCIGRIPWLPIDDAEADSRGWNRNDVIYGMYQQFREPGQNIQNLTAIDARSMERAFHASMAPNPWEQGRYNIPVFDQPNPGGSGLAGLDDQFSQFFAGNGQMAFWAPVFSEEMPNRQDPVDLIKGILKKAADEAAIAGNPLISQMSQQLQAALVSGLGNYLNGIRNSAGENGETFNLARILDPYNTQSTALNPSRRRVAFDPPAQGILLEPTTPRNVKTSFAPNRSSVTRQKGRIGYSVKFIPVRSIASQAGDADLSGDSGIIEH